MGSRCRRWRRARAKLSTRTVGAYASIRKQFSTAIGKFEGIQEPLARIAGLTYAMDASRRLTSGAVDDGIKPAVASAIVKCYLTEGMRQATNDAMDVVGGARHLPGSAQRPGRQLRGAAHRHHGPRARTS